MDVVHGLPGRTAPPAGNATRALEDIQYIRRCVENAASFTAVPGKGMVLVGLTALVTAGLTSGLEPSLPWMVLWLVEGVVALIIGVVALARKARAGRIPLLSGPGRRFALNLLPPLGAGAVLTAVLAVEGIYEFLPGVWLLLYGTAVVTGGAVSVRLVTYMGLSFMSLGAAALFFPVVFANVVMVAGFGLGHLVFGEIVRRRHGG